QPDAVQSGAVRAAGAGAFMFVGGEVVQAEHQQHAQAQSADHRQRRRHRVAQQPFGGLQARQDQREGAGGQHYPGGEAEQAVLGAGPHVPVRQRQQGAQRGGGETGQAAQQGVVQLHRVAVAQGVNDAGDQQQRHHRGGGQQAIGDQRVGLGAGHPAGAQFGVEAGLHRLGGFHGATPGGTANRACAGYRAKGNADTACRRHSSRRRNSSGSLI